jgi:hypothetical protein
MSKSHSKGPFTSLALVLAATLLAGCAADTEGNDTAGSESEVNGQRAQSLRFWCENGRAEPQSFNLYYRTDAPSELNIKAFWGLKGVDVRGTRAKKGTFDRFVAVDAAKSRPGNPVAVAAPTGDGADLINAKIEIDETRMFVTGAQFEGTPDDGVRGTVRVTFKSGLEASYACEMTVRSTL